MCTEVSLDFDSKLMHELFFEFKARYISELELQWYTVVRTL
jgi:hypothetical protein